MEISLFTKCLFEFIGTLVLVLLGDGVVASTVLKRSKGFDGGWIVITIAWGLAVMCGVLIAGPYSGAHLNPAVSVGLAVAGSFPWAYVPGYVAAQLLGGFCGAVVVYLYYKDHFDATDDPAGCVALIRRAGAKAGVSVKPATPVEALREVLPLVDLVLVMSVEPGFGGQSFIPGSLEKIAQLRAMAREMGLETIIEVDGGISARNAGAVYGAGADVLVAGSSVFGAEDPQAEVVKMLNA
jgi:hypothetical protein